MKLHDRYLVEGTNPLIYIGHRPYRSKDGQTKIGKTYFYEYNHEGRRHYGRLKTTNKKAAIKAVWELVQRIEKGETQQVRRRVEWEELTGAPQLVAAVEERCKQALALLGDSSPLFNRNVVQVLIKKLEVDLESREVSIEVAMPSVMVKQFGDFDKVCAELEASRSYRYGAKSDWAITLSSYSCVQQRVNNRFCMECKRTRVSEFGTTPSLAA